MSVEEVATVELGTNLVLNIILVDTTVDAPHPNTVFVPTPPIDGKPSRGWRYDPGIPGFVDPSQPGGGKPK